MIIACDHRGYKVKEKLKKFLNKQKIEYIDGGTNSEERCDFTIYSRKVVNSILKGGSEKGILICGTGTGMCICANRYKGIYAYCPTNTTLARLGREKNNANVLCLAANHISFSKIKKIVKVFLTTSFNTTDKTYAKRLKSIDK